MLLRRCLESAPKISSAHIRCLIGLKNDIRDRCTGIFSRGLATSGSSKEWLKRHTQDQYVKKAKNQDLRSRSSFKLIEIQEKYRVIKPSDVVIDLGAAPGGWSVYVSKIQREEKKKTKKPIRTSTIEEAKVAAAAAAAELSLSLSSESIIELESESDPVRLIAVDLLEFDPIPDCFSIVGDMMAQNTQTQIREALDYKQANVVLSDMLENTTGRGDMDHFRSVELVYTTLDFCR